MNVIADGAGIILEPRPGEQIRIWSHWLRVLSVEADLYVVEAKQWTDGANFHPQRVMVDPECQLRSAEIADDELRMTWTDGTVGAVGLADLERRLQGDPLGRYERTPWAAGKRWLTLGWDAFIHSDAALRTTLEALTRDGVVMISDVPPDVRSAIDIADRLGGLELSQLGESFRIHFAENSRHIGEEMGEIPLHIDLVYRQRPPDFQVLHALHQIDSGGENVFVDIDHVDRQLSDDQREWLRSVVLDFVATSGAVAFRGSHPVLHQDHDRRLRAAYNQYKVQFPVDTPADYFEVFDQFRDLIHRDESSVEFLLPEGHAVIFDNRRVLHGRRAFNDPRRDVIGCYASGDDLRCRLRSLEYANEGSIDA